MTHRIHIDRNNQFKIGKNIAGDVFYIYTEDDSAGGGCTATSLPDKIQDPIVYKGYDPGNNAISVLFNTPDDGGATLSYEWAYRPVSFYGQTGTANGTNDQYPYLWAANTGTVLEPNPWNSPVAVMVGETQTEVVVVSGGEVSCGLHSYYIRPINCSGAQEHSPPTDGTNWYTSSRNTNLDTGGQASGFIVIGDLYNEYEYLVFSGYEPFGSSNNLVFTYATGAGSCSAINPENGNIAYLAARTGYLYQADDGSTSNSILVESGTMFFEYNNIVAWTLQNNASLTGHFYYGVIKERWIRSGPNYGSGSVECIKTIGPECHPLVDNSFFYNNPNQ